MSKLPVLDEYAAGIDVGSERMHVSIAGGAPEVFGSTTTQLHKLRDWLCERQVKSVAIEATGIYWLCLYEVLEAAEIRVFVVNGRHVKNLPGRKTDISDCQWLATLHSHGLLRSGFVPPVHIRRLQDYVRLRQDHIVVAASHVQHMQKALERMNLKPHDVIRSLTGVSGMRVVRAIVAGERDPVHLVSLCEEQIRRKKADRLKEALTGTWKTEHLFALRQALEAWDFYQKQVEECDRAIEAVLRAAPGPDSGPSFESGLSGPSEGEDAPELPSSAEAALSGQGGCEQDSGFVEGGVQRSAMQKTSKGKKRVQTKKAGTNTPQILELRELIAHLCGGKDTTSIPGIAEQTSLNLVAEVGTDLSAWPTAKHFASWAGLAPGSRQSGKRSGSVKRQMNRTGRLFCLAAMAVGRSVDKGLGGFYRRLKARRGGPVANKALARKLATLYWQVMVHGIEFVEEGLAKWQQKADADQRKLINRLANQQGLIVLPKDFLETGVIG